MREAQGRERVSRSQSRSSLAKLLFDLLQRSGINKVPYGSGPRWHHQDQIDALTAVAGAVEIGEGVFLRDWLAKSHAELIRLKSRITREHNGWGRARPHGFFISSFQEIRGNQLNEPYIRRKERMHPLFEQLNTQYGQEVTPVELFNLGDEADQAEIVRIARKIVLALRG